jgi:hypothetical protein
MRRLNISREKSYCWGRFSFYFILPKPLSTHSAWIETTGGNAEERRRRRRRKNKIDIKEEVIHFPLVVRIWPDSSVGQQTADRSSFNYITQQ